jgi:hypothetical protein
MANHICIQADKIEKQQDKLDKLYFAMFGDKEMDEIGTKAKVDEMHKLLTQGNTIKKTLIWVFSVTMSIGGAIILWMELLKSTKSK